MEIVENLPPASESWPGTFATVQRAYERSRLQWALLVALPVLLLPLFSWTMSGRTLSQAVIGSGLFLVVTTSLWLGQGLGQGIPLGLKAGLIPLTLAHAARLYGHACTPTGCTSLCLPACILGGAAAGVLVFVLARRSPAPKRTLVAAGSVSLLTGALGCACVGYSGIVGLIGGMGVTMLAGRVFVGSVKETKNKARQ